MRKSIFPATTTATTAEGVPADENWLDLEHSARVEVSSEDADYPVEAALLGGPGPGWRAAGPGPQTLRLIFDAPRPLRRVWLRFTMSATEPGFGAGAARTQEFVLRWSADGESFRELLRQQWNFNAGAPVETEDYRVELLGVRALELQIIPDVGGGPAPASLTALRLA